MSRASDPVMIRSMRIKFSVWQRAQRSGTFAGVARGIRVRSARACTDMASFHRFLHAPHSTVVSDPDDSMMLQTIDEQKGHEGHGIMEPQVCAARATRTMLGLSNERWFW
jgi:hypothetical protein